MRRFLGAIILLIYASITVHVALGQTGSPITTDDGSFNRVTPGTISRWRKHKSSETLKDARLKGLCRDGWTQGTMRDISGADIPICLKINSPAQTWEDAKSTCRKDYGFLMKLDSIAKWGNEELLSVLFEKGITKTWTGVHTVYDRLVWDDLIPSQVSPSDMTRNSSSSLRPWKWDTNEIAVRSKYCGYLDIEQGDSLDRKKRSSEDDNADVLSNFDLSNFRDRILESNFQQPLSMLNHPRTSAFKSMLSRTQFSDQLPELPSSSLGLQSELQIPGTGLSDANIQEGSLSATISPVFETVTQKDAEDNKDGSSGFDVIENINKEAINLPDTKEDAPQSNDSPLSPLEILKEHMNEMQNIQSEGIVPDSKSSLLEKVGDKLEISDSVISVTTPSPLDIIDNIASDITNDDKGSAIADTAPDTSPDITPDLTDTNMEIKDIITPIDSVNDGLLDKDQVPITSDSDKSNTMSDLIEKVKEIFDVTNDANAFPPDLMETEFAETNTTTENSEPVTEASTSTVPITDGILHNTEDNDDVSKPEMDISSRDKATLPSGSDNLQAISTFVNKVEKDNDHDSTIDIEKSSPSFDETSDKASTTANTEESTTRSWSTTTSSIERTQEKNEAWLDALKSDDDDKIIEKYDTTMSTTQVDVVESLTTIMHVTDDVSERNDIPEDFLQVTAPSLDHVNKSEESDSEDDKTQDKESMDEISETLKNYLSLVSNSSDNTNTGIGDGVVEFKKDSKLQTSLVDLNHDLTDSDFEDLVEEIMGNENDTQKDPTETINDQKIFSHDGDHDESLLESIRDTHDSILGKSVDSKADEKDAKDESQIEIEDKDTKQDEKHEHLESPFNDMNEDINDALGNNAVDDLLEDLKDDRDHKSDLHILEDDNLESENDGMNDKDIVEHEVLDDHTDKNDGIDDKDAIENGEFNDQINDNDGINNDEDSVHHGVFNDENDGINDKDTNENGEFNDQIDDNDGINNDEDSVHHGVFNDENEGNNDKDTNEHDFFDDQNDSNDANNDKESVFDDQNDPIQDQFEEEKERLESINEKYEDRFGKPDRPDIDVETTEATEHEDLHETDRKDDISDDLEERQNNDDLSPAHEQATLNSKSMDDDRLDDVREKISEIEEEMQDPDSLGEIVTPEKARVSLTLPRPESDMALSSCEARLPSVCFSYEVEVMSKASTCDNGWYGHVLSDTCFKILDSKMTYRQAQTTCASLGARVILGVSAFQRTFALIAVQKEGKLFRGEKFWKESQDVLRNRCNYFNERDDNIVTSCNTALRVVCIKDAKSLSVHTVNDDLELISQSGNEVKVEFLSFHPDNTLDCDLTSAASEFPVLWFKDGLLVKTKDKYVTSDISLHLDDNLLDVIRHLTNTNIHKPVLQGKYWCEVWDRKSLTRKRSRGFDVRFTDVISFHGSMELRGFSHRQEVLFNMVNEKFESLSRTEMDIQRVFQDVLPRLQRFTPDILSVYTYADSVRTKPSVVEYHTYFTLKRNYSVTDEDLVYNRLKGLLRSQLGNRRYMSNLEGGTPLQSFRTMSLQSTVSCPATSLQTNKDLFGKTIPLQVFSFPKALLGEFASSINNCSDDSRHPAATARCLGDFHTGAYWGEVVANHCEDETEIDDINQEIWGVSPFTQKLSEISESPVNKNNVEKVVQEIAHIADVAVKFTPSDINKIADILDHSTQIPDLTLKVGKDVVRTVNRLMEMDEREVRMANLETKAANRILKSVDRFADNVNLKKKENMRLVTDNVVVEIWDLKATSRPVIGLAAETQEKDNSDEVFKTEKIATVFESSQLYDIDVDAAIELPKEVFTQKEKGENLGNRLTMVVYRKSKLFDAAVRRSGNNSEPNDKHFENLNSFIISASIAGKKISGLTDKVRTIFRPLQESENSRKCVWWDFMKNDFKGGWSNKGCRYDGKMNGRDVCLCDHLTNFAVLMDFYGQSKPLEDHHELSLSIITVVGLSFSILGLSLTIISYIFFRKLRQGRAQQTLFNLSLALLFSMMVFLVGIKQTHNHYICTVVAVLLHYFILVSFMWMLMEAMLQYLTFVKILGTYITRFTMKTVLPAWGLPLIPVVSVLSIDYNMYKGGPNYCWMSLDAFYYAFMIPISLIILINIVIFFITVISIFRRGKGLRSNQKKQKMAMTNLQAAITSFILLGLTWIFGYLAISDARVVFQYIFTILNSLQGFFIFILFVLRKKKVRDQWYVICCRASEKDRVSRSLSASNSIPSSCSSGSRNGRNKGERDRSDSTKTVQSTYSIGSNSFTNYGYETGFDTPFNRQEKRFFRNF